MNDDSLRARMDRLREALDPGIDWARVQQYASLPLYRLCALSVGLHPDYAQTLDEFLMATPQDSDAENLSPADVRERVEYRDEILGECTRRLSVAANHVAPYGTLTPVPGQPPPKSPAETTIRVADFTTWARGLGWDLPSEFPGVSAGGTEKDTAAPLGQRREETLLKQIGALSRVVAGMGPRYHSSGKPNANQIAEAVSAALPGTEDVPGLSSASIRDSIRKGLGLLDK